MAKQPWEEADNAAQPGSLLSDIDRTQPWLRIRVRALRIHHRQLRDAIARPVGGGYGKRWRLWPHR